MCAATRAGHAAKAPGELTPLSGEQGELEMREVMERQGQLTPPRAGGRAPSHTDRQQGAVNPH